MKLSRWISFILITIMALTPLIIMPLSGDYFYFPKILFVYSLSAILGISIFLQRKRLNLSFNLNDKILLLYFLLIIVSTLLSTNKVNSIWGSYGREEGFFAISTYMFIFLVSKKFYKIEERHIKLFLFSATIVALYGVSQYFGFDPIPRDLIRMNWKGRAFSTMGNPNFLGSYLTLVLPISVFTYIYTKKSIYLLTSGLIYLSLLCTMTRGSWLGAFVGFIFLTTYTFRRNFNFKHLMIIIVLFLFITIAMNSYTNGGIFGRFLTIGKDFLLLVEKSDDFESGGANRIFIWKRVIELIKFKPFFGHGLENLGIISTDYFYKDIIEYFGKLYIFDKAHNEYLHIAVTTGIPSLIVYLIFLWNILYTSFKSVKDNLFIIPLLASIIGYLVQAFFNISVVSVAYIYWVFLGIMLNFSENKSSSQKSTFRNQLDKI